jgi:hypothetical protein
VLIRDPRLLVRRRNGRIDSTAARHAKQPRFHPDNPRAAAAKRTKAGLQTPSAPNTRAITNAGVDPVAISDVLIANSANRRRRRPAVAATVGLE